MSSARRAPVRFITATALAEFVTGRLRRQLSADPAERRQVAAQGRTAHRVHHGNARRFR